MSIEKALAVLGAMTPILAFGGLICAAVEYARKKGGSGSKRQTSLTLRYSDLSGWLAGLVPWPESRDRRKIERALREGEKELGKMEINLRAQAPSKATPQMRDCLIAYFNARKSGSDKRVADTETQLLAQFDREAAEYQAYKDKRDYYRAAVIVVATVVVVIAFAVGIAVALPFIRDVIRHFDGHGKVAAVGEYRSRGLRDVSMIPRDNPSSSQTRTSIAGAHAVESTSPRLSIASATTSSPGERHGTAGTPPGIVCVQCLTGRVTNGVTRIFSGVSSDVNGTISGLTSTVSGTVDNLLIGLG
jgi:hypothetical protein